MKACLLFVLFIFTPITFSQNVSHLYELRGLEDSLGNTHLFYRYKIPVTSCWNKNIYHFEVNNGTDTLFIYDAASDPIGEGCRGQFIYDYEFFDNDPTKNVNEQYQTVHLQSFFSPFLIYYSYIFPLSFLYKNLEPFDERKIKVPLIYFISKNSTNWLFNARKESLKSVHF